MGRSSWPVAAGIGRELGPVEGDASELRQPGPGAQPQDLEKQGAERFDMAAPNAADRALVGRDVRRQTAQRHVLLF